MKENRRVPIPCRTGAAEMQSGDGLGVPDDAASPRGATSIIGGKRNGKRRNF